MSNKQTNGKSSIVVNDNTRVNNWDNIRVYSRFRPLSMTEKELKNQLLSIGVHDSFLLECVQFNSHEQVEIRVPEMPLSFESLTTGDWGDPSIVAQLPAFLGIRSSNRGVSSRTPNEVLCTSHSFDYSMSFQPHSTQENVYEEVGAPLVDDFLSGYNATIFVYGQTGSGKTYTMLGGLKTTHDNGTVLQSFPQSLNMIGNECGIILRSVMQIFRTINDAPDSMSFSLSMYFVEIYMEKVQDLLVADPSQSCLSVREDPKSCNFFVDGCFQPEVTKPDDIFSLLDYGLTNRATAITKMNANSSRSHCILCLSLRSVNSESGEQKTAKLFFVDLAGSEKVGKTKATGQQLREAKVINKSLTALGLVIDSLSDRNSTHIPYRDSKLTKILQNSLGGNSRTTLVVCCSPSIENISETLSTLRFGQRSKSVKNKPFINNEYNVDEFKILLEAAKRKIASLQYNRSLPIPIREKTAEENDMLSSTSSDTTKNRIKELEQALHEEIIKNKRHSEEKAELICTIHKLNAELREANELCEVLKANSYRVQNNVVTPLQIEVGEWVREYQCLIEELYRTKKTSVSLMEDLQFEREINECLICLLEEHKSEINSIKAQVQSEQIKIYSTRRNSLSDTVSGHISFVDALARLALEKKQRDRVEASLKELISENGSLSLELDLLTEKLSISAQRIDNLKKGINDEQQTYRIFKDKMEVELEELRGKMLDARKDSVHWRLKYDRLLTTKEASGNSHDESLNTLRTIPTNSKIGERRQSGGSDLCQSVSQQNAGFFQQTLLDGFKKDVITEGVVIRCTSASFNSNCMPNMGKLEGVVQTLIAEEKENGGDNGCDASHNLYQRTFN